jgi:hypothetical protein
VEKNARFMLMSRRRKILTAKNKQLAIELELLMEIEKNLQNASY